MAEQLTLRGTLKGHNGWVTQIATTPMFPDMILSSSRDKSIIIWKLTKVGRERRARTKVVREGGRAIFFGNLDLV